MLVKDLLLRRRQTPGSNGHDLEAASDAWANW